MREKGEVLILKPFGQECSSHKKKLIPRQQTYSIGGTVTRIQRDTVLWFVTPVLIW